MAPEQACGQPVDHRSDLFSLGCVLYRLCTGEMPFKGPDTIAILKALALDNPLPPMDFNLEVPVQLSELVMQLLAKKPEDRPESAQAVVKALQELEGNGADRMVQPSRKQPSTRQRRTEKTSFIPKPVAGQKKWPLVAGAGMLAVLALLWFFLFRPGDNQASRDSPRPALRKDFTNTLGMKFRLIPPGKFTMGSPKEEIDRCLKLVGKGGWEEGSIKSEGPAHEVEITHPFYLGETEVTVGQFRKFVDQKKYNVGDDRWKKQGFEQFDDSPVVFVTWNNAVDFCLWLGQKEGKNYRLPTEAEWEYSCRAGTKSRYSFGDNEGALLNYAWINTNSKGRTQAVKQLKPNPWKLHDMHGNVWEWCADVYDPNYYKSSPAKDPPGPSAGGSRVVRGGSWGDAPVRCRSAFRSHYSPGYRFNFFGFRVVREPSSPGGVGP